MNTEPQKPGGKPGENNERVHKCCLATAGAVGVDVTVFAEVQAGGIFWVAIPFLHCAT